MAGGRSRRMGTDKALLPWGEATLLDHALARLRAVTAEVRVLCGEELRYLDHGVPVLADSEPGLGPLGGLRTALEAAPLAVFLGVDLPFVPAELLAFLLQAAEGHDAVVPFSAQGPEPLCAVYRASCLPAVAARLAAGERRMTAFWPDVDVLQVTDEVARFGDPGQLFRNLNTREDYERGRCVS